MEKPKELPTGTGEEFIKERRKETLPAIEIANEVLWVNPAFEGHLPFKLLEGQPTDLGVFFTRETESEQNKVRRLIIMPESYQGRSGLLGEVIFSDRDGRTYRDVDLKGMGRFWRSENSYSVAPIEQSGEKDADGLMDRGYAQRDRDYSEMFTKAGIRTSRALAIIELKEIVDQAGNKISITEAKKRKMLPQVMQPVLLLRAFGTKERIDYIREVNVTIDRRRSALEDAIELVRQELSHTKEGFYLDDYLKWFAETLGTQVAKMKKLGVHHEYISEHNITLDCRIVDLDSVLPIKDAVEVRLMTEENLYEGDHDHAKSSLRNLYEEVRNLYEEVKNIYVAESRVLKRKVTDLFENAYQKELTS